MSIAEASEININEDGRPHLRAGSGNASSEELDLQDAYYPTIIYTIRSPTALQNLFSIQSSGSVKTIRLILLQQLESSSLTEEEENGGIGPNIGPWFSAWRDAFKSIPPAVQLIQVDITHSFQMRTLMLGKLVQHLSTTIYLRSRGKTKFAVVGARTRDGKAFIEGSMVGLTEDSRELKGSRKLVIGAE